MKTKADTRFPTYNHKTQSRPYYTLAILSQPPPVFYRDALPVAHITIVVALQKKIFTDEFAAPVYESGGIADSFVKQAFPIRITALLESGQSVPLNQRVTRNSPYKETLKLINCENPILLLPEYQPGIPITLRLHTLSSRVGGQKFVLKIEPWENEFKNFILPVYSTPVDVQSRFSDNGTFPVRFQFGRNTPPPVEDLATTLNQQLTIDDDANMNINRVTPDDFSDVSSSDFNF